MTGLLKRFMGQMHHGTPRHDEPWAILETNDTGPTLSNEIESFETLLVEQLAKLKARAENGTAAVPQTIRQQKQTPVSPRTMDRAATAGNFHSISTEQRPDGDNDAVAQISGAGYARQRDEPATYRECASESGSPRAGDDISKRLAEWNSLLETKLNSSNAQLQRTASEIEQLLMKVERLTSSAQEQEYRYLRQQADITDLRNQLKQLTATIGRKGYEATARKIPAKADEESSLRARERAEISHPAKAAPQAASSESAAPRPDPQFLSPAGAQRITFELAEALNVIEKLAALLLRRQSKALGETLERFPMERLSELFDALGSEIPDSRRRADFRQRMDRMLRGVTEA